MDKTARKKRKKNRKKNSLVIGLDGEITFCRVHIHTRAFIKCWHALNLQMCLQLTRIFLAFRRQNILIFHQRRHARMQERASYSFSRKLNVRLACESVHMSEHFSRPLLCRRFVCIVKISTSVSTILTFDLWILTLSNCHTRSLTRH